jgi:hypothetical protein
MAEHCGVTPPELPSVCGDLGAVSSQMRER